MGRLALTLVLFAGACGGNTPADVAGTYSLSLTVRQNQCGILANSTGQSSSGVQVVVTQTGSQVSAQVQGVAGIALALAMGKDTFAGTVSDTRLDLAIAGTMPGSNGTCAYTRNARLLATVSGDVMVGTVTYTYATNKTADCGTRDTCQDIQDFNGTRPPTVGP